MNEAKRWFNDFFFAPSYANFGGLESFSDRSFVVAEDENDFCIMRLPNLLAKHRKLIEHVLCASGMSMKEIACDQKSVGIACINYASKALEVVLCRSLRNRHAGVSKRCSFSEMNI